MTITLIDPEHEDHLSECPMSEYYDTPYDEVPEWVHCTCVDYSPEWTI